MTAIEWERAPEGGLGEASRSLEPASQPHGPNQWAGSIAIRVESGRIRLLRKSLYDLAVAQAPLPGGVAEFVAPPAEIFSVGPNDRS